MKIPDKIKIGALTYTVIYCDEPSEETRATGHILYEKQEIRLQKGMTAQHNERVFLHEVVHGILHEMDVKENNDERFVNLLSAQLHILLKENGLR